MSLHSTEPVQAVAIADGKLRLGIILRPTLKVQLSLSEVKEQVFLLALAAATHANPLVFNFNYALTR